MTHCRIILAIAIAAVSAFSGCSSTPPTVPIAPAAAPSTVDLDPWPREIQTKTELLRIYSPQVESWQGNLLKFRFAISAAAMSTGKESFGVVWGEARTHVDREARMVALEGQTLTRANFPSLPDNGAGLLAELAAKVALEARTVALDRIEASLAASGAATLSPKPVKNPVPKIIVRQVPSVLIPVRGAPELRKIPEQRFVRVLNSRALIVREENGRSYYLHLYDGWLEAPAVAGPWALAGTLPLGIDALARSLAAVGQVDLLDGGSAQPPPSLGNGVPAVIVRSEPAELIVTHGPPEFVPISGTSLLFCSNTTSDLILDESKAAYYLLISGRWYQARGLTGPWSFVSSSALPADFAAIPTSSPAGVVLASVAGTPQAHEAVISNSVPQTASVSLADPPRLDVSYDGAPTLRPIPGTPLQYVANSATPVIRVAANDWYAVHAGVWFSSKSTTGPWTVARAVPSVIYTIPTQSPLHYVTYVQVYEATAESVQVGYTPGYLGTVVAPEGVVVYGTGYDYAPWIGTVYYEAPPTYGVAAQPIYNPEVGWSYGYGEGLATPAVVGVWGTPYYYGAVYHGYPCCASTSVNVYGHAGAVNYSGTAHTYVNSSSYGVKSSGSYANTRTGTTGTYDTNRSYNYDTNTSKTSASRTYDTAAGGSGSASHSGSYDWDNGRYTTSSSRSGTTASGSDYSHSSSTSGGGGQPASVDRETSYTSSKTGQTYTTGTGERGNDLYASPSGEVHQNTAGGWQKSTAGGWQRAGGDNAWADREAQGRSRAQSSFGSFSGRGGFGGGGRGGFGGGGGGRRR